MFLHIFIKSFNMGFKLSHVMERPPLLPNLG